MLLMNVCVCVQGGPDRELSHTGRTLIQDENGLTSLYQSAMCLMQEVNKHGSKTRHQLHVECGSSAVECRTRNRESPGSNPPLLPFRNLGIFVLSTTPHFTQLYR